MVAGSVKNKRPSSAMSFRGVSREIPRDRNENNRTRTPQIFARGGSPSVVRGGEATKGSEATANPYYLHHLEPRSNPWFLFICVKGVAGIIVKTKVAEKKISYDWLTKPRQNGKFVKKTK